MEEWDLHRDSIKSLYIETQAGQGKPKTQDNQGMVVSIRDGIASGNLDQDKTTKALESIGNNTVQSWDDPEKLTSELSSLSSETLKKLYGLVTGDVQDVQPKDENMKDTSDLEYIRSEMQRRHGFEAR